jgi:RNA polymerase sigma factor (sigma-70 family)
LTATPTSSAPPDERQAELLERWSRRYRPALLRFFHRRMPAGADPEDLVQEVFVRLARREDLANVENIDGYLFQAAANILTDWRRKQLTHAASAHGELDEHIEDVGFTPERVLIGKETLRSLLGALSMLPERTRAVFMLYHFEGLSHAEIGRRLSIAVRTVEDHIARANQVLARALGERP